MAMVNVEFMQRFIFMQCQPVSIFLKHFWRQTASAWPFYSADILSNIPLALITLIQLPTCLSKTAVRVNVAAVVITMESKTDIFSFLTTDYIKLIINWSSYQYCWVSLIFVCISQTHRYFRKLPKLPDMVNQLAVFRGIIGVFPFFYHSCNLADSRFHLPQLCCRIRARVRNNHLKVI